MNQTIKWTVDGLRARLCNNDSINEFYRNMPRHMWVFNRTDVDILPGESWRPCREPYKNVMASNLGRIKIDDKIVVPIDEIGDYGGYLKIEQIGEYVYNLVANAWLDGDKGTGCETHHISNDGYDNRPENLMYLPHDIHQDVHHGKTQPEIEYKCPIYNYISTKG